MSQRGQGSWFTRNPYSPRALQRFSRQGARVTGMATEAVLHFWWRSRFLVEVLLWERMCSFLWLLVGAWRERRGQYLLAGMPALAVALGAIYPILSADVEGFYQREAQQATQAHNSSLAVLCFERLSTLRPGNATYRFRLALAAEAVGQLERASAILRDLAPTAHARGYGPAQLRLAQGLLAKPNASAQDKNEAESRLRRALDDDTVDPQASLLLGQHLMATGRADQAEPHLLRAVEVWPELRLPLARYYLRKGQKEKSIRQAARAASVFEDLAKRNPEDATPRIHWAETLTLGQQFPTALSVLEAGSQASSPDRRQARAQVYAQWAEYSEGDGRAEPKRVFSLIERGLAEDPTNASLLLKLLDFTRQDGAAGDKARQALQDQLAQGTSPALLHVALGMDLWQQGDKAGAKQHLEQAYQAVPETGLIANNLAWMLAFSDPPDLKKSYDLVETALRRWPNQPRFRNTRGHILAKLGRWQEAVTDLEASLDSLPDKSNAHRTLAEAYDHLGLPAMAAKHQSLAAAKAP
jgi:tetratricopeptide (TPR) repeat protein